MVLGLVHHFTMYFHLRNSSFFFFGTWTRLYGCMCGPGAPESHTVAHRSTIKEEHE